MYLDDDYYDHSFSMLSSFIRVRVTAPTEPTTTRTFDMCQRAPESWIIDAFLLSVGHPEQEARDRDHDDREVRALTFGGDPYVDIPGVAAGCRIEVLSSRTAAVGEPCVQIVDSDATESADAHWQSAPAPLRRAHVQQELTRRFGIVMPVADRSGVGDLTAELGGSSPLVSLLLTLPPARRLALRAHLKDAGMLDTEPVNAATAAELLEGLSWLVDRLGPDGVEQNDHGGFPDSWAREAESALDWTPISNAPPSPGHALLDLARSARFTRRLKGRILPTARTRMIKEKPLRALAEMYSNAAHAGYSYSYSWTQDHARTLALLAIADGSAADTAGVIRSVAQGLGILTDFDGGSGDAADATDAAREAVRELMEVLAPLGGPGAYGMLTPAVRAFVRGAVLMPVPPF